MPLILSIALGLILGVAAGGKLKALSHVELRRPGVLISLFVVQGLARGRLGGPEWPRVGLLVWAFTTVILVALIVAESKTPLSVVGCGFVLNLFVVLANGFMPVVPVTNVLSRAAMSDGFYALVRDGGSLVWLADVIALPLLGSLYYLSAGDLLIAAGAAGFVVQVMSEPGTSVHQLASD